MSFQQGLSGLNATSKSLDVIGNNIANSGTYGAKASRAEFADMYAAALNGAGTNNIGIGTTVADVAQQFTQGNITTTDNPMDVAGASFPGIRVGPNPTSNGSVTITSTTSRDVVVYDAEGRRVGITVRAQGSGLRVELPQATGTYHVVVRDGEVDHLFRVMRLQE